MDKNEFRYRMLKLIFEYYRQYPGMMVVSKIMSELDKLDKKFEKESIQFVDLYKLEKIDDTEE